MWWLGGGSPAVRVIGGVVGALFVGGLAWIFVVTGGEATTLYLKVPPDVRLSINDRPLVPCTHEVGCLRPDDGRTEHQYRWVVYVDNTYKVVAKRGEDVISSEDFSITSGTDPSYALDDEDDWVDAPTPLSLPGKGTPADIQ